MPRETIYDETSQYHLTVGWQHNGADVQVGVETADGRTLAEHLTESSAPGEAAAFKSVWGNLSRSGVNDLIRLLRKARESAFGRDE